MLTHNFLLIPILFLLIKSEILLSDANDDGTNCTQSELEALLNFRAGLVDPEDRLSSWKGNSCCQWHGIGCDNSTGVVNMIDLHNPYPLIGYDAQPGSDLGSLNVHNLEWVTKFGYLKHLRMNNVDLSIVGPDWSRILTNLTSLTALHLQGCGLSTLSPVYLPALSDLDLSMNSFNSKFPDWVLNLTSLSSLDLSSCGFYGRIPLSLSELPNLRSVSLAMNYNLTASCTQLLRGSWPKIEVLELGSNKLHGKLPAAVGNMTSLTYLGLFDNNIGGGIPGSIGKLCNLSFLWVSINNMTGSLPEYLEGMETCVSKTPMPSLQRLWLSNNKLVGRLPEWLGQLGSLEELELDYNQLEGPIPVSLGSLQLLTSMGLAGNNLNGTVPESFGQLSELGNFDVSFNDLTGIVSEAHFSKLSKLMHLHLSSNSLILNFNEDWVPPFQIIYLALGSYIDLSSNLFEGPIPLPSVEVELFSLSFNKFSGVIPYNIGKIMPNLIFLSLGSNRLSGEIPSSIGEMVSLEVIDLSNNSLTGYIPPGFGNCFYLKALDLGYNNLSGEIPESYGKLQLLQSLHLDDNNFSGELPSSLQNLSSLETLDLANNRFSGDIPAWLGDHLTTLKILSLRSNSFSGRIPTNFPGLSKLQVLDLALNNFTGMIPANLGNLTGMSHDQMVNQYRFYGFYRGIYYKERLVVNLEGGFLQIPVGGQMATFGESSFSGNPNLCGPPLAVNCGSNSSDNTPPLPNEDEDESDNDIWFPLSIGLGFATGILVPWLILSIRRPWGDAYFGFVESVIRRIERATTKTAQVKVTDQEHVSLPGLSI
ncbi:hypothetical protein L1887_18008 [Cichorium endivia]|nr:hypothetical protein L1887_18008 [Cichorium endivia]